MTSNRNGVSGFLGTHEDPRRFICQQGPQFFKRPACRDQVFADLEVAENFAQFMRERGLHFTVIRKCKRCQRIHVIGGL